MIFNPASNKATALINSITASPGFSADPACNGASVRPGSSLICNVTFTPIGLGPVKNAALTVNYNGTPKSPHLVKLIGRGIQGKLTVTRGSLDFTDVPVNTTSTPQIVSLSNKTGATFNITSISTGNPAFTVTHNCLGMLGAADCPITVTYSANSPGRISDLLTISDLPDGIVKEVKLTGIGK